MTKPEHLRNFAIQQATAAAVTRSQAIAMVALCGCVQSPIAAVEPAVEPEPTLAPTLEQPPPVAHPPLDPEIAALLTPEALRAAAEAAEPKPPPPDPRTPAERARELCEDRCAREFDRDAMIRRLTHGSSRADQNFDHHGAPPELSDADGLRRFVDGEPSTIWYLDGNPRWGWIFVLYINPDLERAQFPFHGLLFEIDAEDRVVRCRYAESDEPEASVEMTCPR